MDSSETSEMSPADKKRWERGQKKPWRWSWKTALAVIFILGALAAYFYFGRGKKKAESSRAAVPAAKPPAAQPVVVKSAYGRRAFDAPTKGNEAKLDASSAGSDTLKIPLNMQLRVVPADTATRALKYEVMHFGGFNCVGTEKCSPKDGGSEWAYVTVASDTAVKFVVWLEPKTP